MASAAEDVSVHAVSQVDSYTSRSFLRASALLGMMAALVGLGVFGAKDLKRSFGDGKHSFADRLRENPNALAKNPFILYLGFLLSGSILYGFLAGGSSAKLGSNELIDFGASIAESFGLLVLQHKISHRKSVTGISGSSILMFVLSYTSRCWHLFPKWNLKFLNKWVLEFFSIVSLLQVSIIAWAIFKTYRRTYQEQQDVVKIYHLVPACAAIALVLHPVLHQGFWTSTIWAFAFYMDTAALIPQVTMMAQSGGTVEAPIAHFVAATTISRVVDLWFWYDDHELGPQGYIYGFNYSGWLIVAVHVLSLLLVADFMYYYLKERFSGASFSEDLSLPL